MNTTIAYFIKYPSTDVSNIKVNFKQEFDSYATTPQIENSDRVFHCPEFASQWLSDRIKESEKYIHLGNYEENVKKLNELKNAKVTPISLTLKIG